MSFNRSTNPDRLAATEAALDHPSDEELRALSLGRLSEAELARVSAHLDDCSACSQRIDQLAEDDHLLARLRQGASNQEDVLISPAQLRLAVRALRRSDDGGSAANKRDPEAEPVILRLPKQVGDYDVLAEVGRGGMGVVYKAWHRSLHRLAALKMILAGEFASPTQELRFRLEAELAARVQHPNIVQVYEIGSYEGRPFLALEWVDGGSLANCLDGKPWPPAEAALLTETLARAIDVAHGEGVIHRDLKPANILMSIADSHDRSAVCDPKSGIPKIADFGLAQMTQGGQTMTQTGFLVGTPGYMAPEQASGKRALVGPATDIYALGVMLYQLLTGQLPFERDSTLELLRAVTSDEPIPPRRLQPRLPRDLEAITLHCLEKEPAKRYASALELAADLRRFQAGEVIAARPPSPIERASKFVRRYKALVGGAAATGLALVVGTVFSLLFAFGEARQRREAERNGRLVQREAYQARLATAVMALRESKYSEAARQLDAAPEGLRGWEWRHLQARVSDMRPTILRAQPEFDELYTYFPPGRGLLVKKANRFLVADQQTRTVLRDVCDVASFRDVAGHYSGGSFLAYARPDGSTTLLDEAGVETNVPVRCTGQASASRDGKLLAVWNRTDPNDRRLRLFELPSGRLRWSIEKPELLRWVTFSFDGTRLAGGSREPDVFLWDAATGAKTLLHGHAAAVNSVAFHPDGKRLVSGSVDKTVRQWDVDAGQMIDVRRGHTDEVLAVTYSPDGLWIASSSADKTVRIWKNDDSEPPTVLAGHDRAAHESIFSPDGLTISVTSAPEFRWRVWPTPAASNRFVLRGHTGYIYHEVHSPDGRLLASAAWDDDHGIRLWDAASGALVAVLTGHKYAIFSLAFSPDSRRLLSRSDDTTVRVWDAETGAPLAVLNCDVVEERSGPQSVVVTPDGRTIFTGAPRGLRCWDVATGKERDQVPLPLPGMRILAVQPRGDLLAASGNGPNIVLFDLAAGQIRTMLTHPTGRSGVNTDSLAFSPDGRQLLSAGRTGEIQLWDVESGKLVRELRGHAEGVFAAIFHPDGQRIFSAGRDHVIRVWDPVQGDELVDLTGHTNYVFSLSFSPDGATLASGSGDFTIRLWETERLGRLLDVSRAGTGGRGQLAGARLLERLFRRLGSADRVAELLRTETMGNVPLQRAARNALYRRQGLAPR